MANYVSNPFQVLGVSDPPSAPAASLSPSGAGASAVALNAPSPAPPARIHVPIPACEKNAKNLEVMHAQEVQSGEVKPVPPEDL